MGKRIIDIHFTSNLKPNKKEGSSDDKLTPDGLNKKTVETRNNVKIKT